MTPTMPAMPPLITRGNNLRGETFFVRRSTIDGRRMLTQSLDQFLVPFSKNRNKNKYKRFGLDCFQAMKYIERGEEEEI